MEIYDENRTKEISTEMREVPAQVDTKERRDNALSEMQKPLLEQKERIANCAWCDKIVILQKWHKHRNPPYYYSRHCANKNRYFNTRQYANCQECKNEFLIKYGNQKFCSVYCKNLYSKGLPNPKLRNGKYLECPTCGKQVYNHRWRLKINKPKFCSRKCSSNYPLNKVIFTKNLELINKVQKKDKHPHWKGGYPRCISCGIELSNRKAKRCLTCNNKIMVGEHAAHWKGGISKDKSLWSQERIIRYKNMCREYGKIDYIKNREKRIEESIRYSKQNRKKINARAKIWREKNKDRLNDKARKYYHDNRDKIMKRCKEHRQLHKDIMNEKCRLYYAKTKERRLALGKMRRTNNPQPSRFNAKCQRYWIRNRVQNKWQIKKIRINDLREIYERDKICVYCKSDKNLTFDHIVSLYSGGDNNKNNLVVACNKCNSSKNRKDVFEWCRQKNITVPEIVTSSLEKQKEQLSLLILNEGRL